MWRVGSKLTHPFNPELGVGLVKAVEGRYLHVYFPAPDQELTLAQENSGLTRLILEPGSKALLLTTEETVEIAEVQGHQYLLSDGREIDDAKLWPLDTEDSPIDKLAKQKTDSLRSFRNRLDGLKLQELRESGGLGSFLGGRIDLFPHQLYTAMRAVEQNPVRWLLADEVGLGKTVEACLILSALLRTGRAHRALILAPSTLTVQWLGELYRKFHQVFVLLDRERLDAVEATYGPDVNPFEVHPFGVMSLDVLASDARFMHLALEAQHDLVVVDEAHRLQGQTAMETIGPLVLHAKHALLLTATPLHADREGFFQLVSLLYPEQFPSFDDFQARLKKNEVSLPCTSSIQRADVGGFPPRRAIPIDLPAAKKDATKDPRAAWIAEQAKDWLSNHEKALIFVNELRTLEKLKTFLESATQTRVSVFHEQLAAAARDIEIARFRESNAPILICTEAGGEGRNFQFCDRMLHYDLPADPVMLEQRIGRLDRIGRKKDVEIVYFRTEGAKPDLAKLYEQLELFERPAAGFDPALRSVRETLAEKKSFKIVDVCAEVENARKITQSSLPKVLYPDAYDSSMAEEVLARVPENLEAATKKFALGAAENLGLKVIDKGGEELYYLELGSSLKVEALPGVPSDARYLGTFDRAEAVDKEEFEFFASGHPLIEGLMLELEDGNRGRAAAVSLEDARLGEGLLCIYKRNALFEARAVNPRGPMDVERVLEAFESSKRIPREKLQEDELWSDRIRLLAKVLDDTDPAGELVAAAYFRPREA